MSMHGFVGAEFRLTTKCGIQDINNKVDSTYLHKFEICRYTIAYSIFNPQVIDIYSDRYTRRHLSGFSFKLIDRIPFQSS